MSIPGHRVKKSCDITKSHLKKKKIQQAKKVMSYLTVSSAVFQSNQPPSTVLIMAVCLISLVKNVRAPYTWMNCWHWTILYVCKKKKNPNPSDPHPSKAAFWRCVSNISSHGKITETTGSERRRIWIRRTGRRWEKTWFTIGLFRGQMLGSIVCLQSGLTLAMQGDCCHVDFTTQIKSTGTWWRISFGVWWVGLNVVCRLLEVLVACKIYFYSFGAGVAVIFQQIHCLQSRKLVKTAVAHLLKVTQISVSTYNVRSSNLFRLNKKLSFVLIIFYRCMCLSINCLDLSPFKLNLCPAD